MMKMNWALIFIFFTMSMTVYGSTLKYSGASAVDDPQMPSGLISVCFSGPAAQHLYSTLKFAEKKNELNPTILTKDGGLGKFGCDFYSERNEFDCCALVHKETGDLN
jgi:hypothetical protein